MSGQKISALLTMAALFFASAEVSQAAEAIPAALQPPAGYTIAFKAKATGVQVYTSKADGAALKWTFEAPLAELTETHGNTLHHYAGPSWEAADGSKVTRDAATPVASIPATRAIADIPWLLVKVVADPAAGVLSKVAYVQRISTQGGAAPDKPPVRVGTTVGVPYTATYVFYAPTH